MKGKKAVIHADTMNIISLQTIWTHLLSINIFAFHAWYRGNVVLVKEVENNYVISKWWCQQGNDVVFMKGRVSEVQRRAV